jgi:N-acetylneuraminate synthase
MGAKVIEKHFTVSRAEGGVDSAFSLEPSEMKELTIAAQTAFKALGSIFYGPTDEEIPSLKFRRSLYVVKQMKRGEQFTSENIRSIRPANGLSTKRYEDILTKKATCDIPAGMPLAEDMFEGGI